MYKDKPQVESPLKAIKEHCRECMDNLYSEIKNCPGEGKCQLWPFRLGINPYRTKRILSEEQKAKLVETLTKSREAKAKKNDS